ncbi:MAG: hypothetical protein NZ531_00595 [Aquificaceae bacterium]|nr:hypothetical protein [Aquificaceae bacterium]
MEMDKETKELLNKAIQMGVFQNRESILTQITNALGEEYEIDKQALKEVVETYRKMLKFDAWAPIVFIITLPFFLFTGIIFGIYLGYLHFKFNSNLAKVLKPKSGKSV